ncbi:hypothetical protein Gpo141_00002257 [Globisporangium polare]
MNVNTFGGGTLLLGNEQEDSLDSLDTPDDVPCSMPETTAVGDTNVLVLMSTCLSTTTRSLVTSWISKLSDQNLLYFDGSSAYTIKFVVKYVVGAKGTPSANCPANGDDTYTKVSDRPANTIAGIFFVNDAQAQKVVETKFPNDIKEQFFLQLCETPTCTALTHKVSGNDVPYVMVSSASDLAAISPFSVARALHCENLAGGIPFSYVDTAGNRQCFCSCAATAKRVISGTGVNRSYQCVKNDPRGVCTWKPAAGSAAGFKKEVTVVGTDGACSTAADDVLSVLYPVDNYVDYLRTNDQDTTSGKNVGAGPRISFDITKGSSVVTKPFAWKEFQTSPSAAMKSLPFAGYGVFDIKATATDYFSTTGVSCAGCIAVVDKARPIPASGCPSTIPGTTLTEFKDVYTFYLPSTKVTATAKSKCGTIASFTFHVNLHVNNVIQVCDHFKAMWYQTSRSAVRSFGDFFLYPGSDFAEITFDYHPNIGLGYDINEFQHTISTVSCTATYASRTSKTIVDVGASDSKEIVKQFAMQAVYLDLTKAETSIDVLCIFKYSSTNIAATDILTQKCPATLTIKDEEAPWVLTSAAKCNRDGACGALPAPYQACGGYRVYATVTTTEVTDQETACCAACTGTGTSNVAPTCSPILGLPGSAKFKDIKRCQPTAAQESLTAESFASSELVAETSATTDTSGVTAVLAASALVALVALVVVQQRRRGHDSMAATRNGCAIEEDAYYPLLN